MLDQPMLQLAGLHFHLGSQVTEPAAYAEAIRRVVALMADVRTRHGVLLTELNIGGGHGVPYIAGDAELDLVEFADSVDDALDSACAAERFPRPAIVVEPGRAVACRAGVTCYRVMSVRRQPGGRPPVVAVRDGRSRMLVRRETVDDLLARDTGPTPRAGSDPIRGGSARSSTN